ncbi:MAG: uracil-DNA glycosylase [Bacteroidales bacterium]|nr:uracil-DNA glycosylase [Bacteroidales bacterium]
MDKIERLHIKVAKCSKCITITDFRKFQMKAHGNFNSKNMIISEAPAGKSLDNGKFWTGESGELLRDCILEAGLKLENDFYITDVVKCWPHINKKNRPPNSIEINNCKKFIEAEIDLLKPKNIFLFGKYSVELYIKNKFLMKDINGQVINLEDGTNLYPFYHPSYVLKQNNLEIEISYMEILTNNLKKVFET